MRDTSPSPTSFPPLPLQVKSESLAIPQKLQLKVDVESGKLIIKKSKDGSEDKFYSHKKSKTPHARDALVLLVPSLMTSQ